MLAPGGSGGPEILDGLRAEAERAWQLTHAQRFGELGSLLGRAIHESEELARQCDHSAQRAAFVVVVDVYQAASAFLAAVGETELGWVAADRAAYASDRAGDILMAAASDFRLGHAFLSGGRFDDACRATATAAVCLEPQVNEGTPEAVSLWGALHLVAAIASARGNRGEDARVALRVAERAAAMLGSDRNDYHTEFGHTNVRLHAVAVIVESGRPAEALREARLVEASGLSPERRARFLIDVARAHAQRRDVASMMRALREAEDLAPEGVRHNWLVREMVHDVLRRLRQPGRDVRGFARRLGVI